MKAYRLGYAIPQEGEVVIMYLVVSNVQSVICGSQNLKVLSTLPSGKFECGDVKNVIGLVQ